MVADSFEWGICPGQQRRCPAGRSAGCRLRRHSRLRGRRLRGSRGQARAGLDTQTYNQYGTISAEYAYTKSGTAGSYSFIGVYGWTSNPIHEFYIIDDWFGSVPANVGTLKGSLAVDGGTYNIYTYNLTNATSPWGTQTYVQYRAVRQTARQCGHISVNAHFDKWASLSMPLGNLYEASLLVEVGGASGAVDYTLATLTTTN